MGKTAVAKNREGYFQKLDANFREYSTVFLVNADNVRSNQFHQIRKSLRGDSAVLMGKKTLIKHHLLNSIVPNDPNVENILKYLVGNVGFVFTNAELREAREKILGNRMRAPAKAGTVSPIDVIVPAGNTGMDPAKTSFFQALGISTKISRGTVEIVKDVHLLKPNSKVGASEATLLNMLKISPFTYGLSIIAIYDKGCIFDPSVLDIDSKRVTSTLEELINKITGLSLGASYPTKASIPHIFAKSIKNLIALSIAIKTEADPESSEEPVTEFDKILRERFGV